MKVAQAKHERELEKLRLEIVRTQQQSKSTFLSELENQQSLLEAQKTKGAPAQAQA